jgi:ParB family chromosome partitioning protein
LLYCTDKEKADSALQRWGRYEIEDLLLFLDTVDSIPYIKVLDGEIDRIYSTTDSIMIGETAENGDWIDILYYLDAGKIEDPAAFAAEAGTNRGGSLFDEPVIAENTDTVETLRITLVEPNKNQPRHQFDNDKIEELAESIKEHGVIQPIIVVRNDDRYKIVAGERRWRAAKKAGLKEIPAVIRNYSEFEIAQIALIENLQRSALNPLEEAQGYRDLIAQHSFTQEDLGKVLSKSRSAISNAMRLLDLPEDVQDLVRDGLLSAGHARAILSVEGDEDRSALARKVVKDGLSVRQTEILAPLFSVKEARVPSKRQPTPSTYKNAAHMLRDHLAAKVSVRTVRGKHKIEIEFDDEDELDAIVNKIVAGKDDREEM